MSKIVLTIGGESWAEVAAHAREVAATAQGLADAGRGSQWETAHLSGIAPAPVPLPLDKPPASGVMPPPEYECPEHRQVMRFKPAGTNRQGTPYAAGFRCPVQGCRQFVPVAA
jgi:hypothetical protein